jgi:DNA-binding response OmpR family regulator
MICLIVEDDADTRDTLAILLSKKQIAVKTASNLYTALDILKDTDETAGIMLLDYNLPGMPMTEFIREVKSIKPTIEIVLSTASSNVQHRSRQLGLEWYLPKPIMPEELYDLCDKLLPAK